MRLAIFRKSLRDERLQAVLSGLVLFAIALMDVLIWPEYRDSFATLELPEYFEAFLGQAGSLGTPEGFLSAEYFSWVTLVLITVAVISGTHIVAGEESNGTLEFLLSLPVRRSHYLLGRTAGIAVALLGAALLGWAGFMVAKIPGSIALGGDTFLLAVISQMPLVYLFLALAVLAGALSPRRSLAAFICIGAVIAAYFANAIGGAVSSLDWLQRASPFYWADGGHVLVNGFDWARFVGMTTAAAILMAAALWCFERRDIGAGTLSIRRKKD